MSQDDLLYRKITWRLIPFLMLCYFLAFLDRTNVAFAKLGFAGALGFDDAVYGMGVGLLSLGYISLEVPSNALLQRIGFRATLLRIMVAWGLLSACMAFMVAPWHFYVLRILLGAAEAGFFPGVIFYLTRWAPQARRARMTALFMASIPIAGILGGPISGAIMQGMDGYAGYAGWQWVFISQGLPSCLVAFIGYAYFKERPSDAAWLTAEEKARISRDLQSDTLLTPPAGASTSILAVLRQPPFYALAMTAFALLTCNAGAFQWLPTILRNSGVADVWTIGLYSSIPFLFGTLIQFGVARSSDRLQERRLHAALALIVGGGGWIWAAFLQDRVVLELIAMTLAISGVLAAMGPFWTLPSLFFRDRSTAIGIAVITTVGGIGNLVSPPIVGFISVKTGSLMSAQFYFAALALLSAFALLVALPRRALRQQPTVENSVSSVV